MRTIQIKSIKKKGIEETYDLKVYPYNNFYLTNGILTHNSGKSVFAFQIGKYVDPTLNLSRVAFNAEEFRNIVFKAKKSQCVVFDEAFVGLSSRGALSQVNRTLVSLMMQMRQKNLFVIIVLPTFFLLDKYVALFRARALIHVYENKGVRGYFRLYNSKLKKLLYIFGKKDYSYGFKISRTKFKGRFYGKFVLEDELLYKKMKNKALQDTEKNPMTATQIKYRNERDICLFLLRKYSRLSYRELQTLLNDYNFEMSYKQISRICGAFGDKDTTNEKISKEILVKDEELGEMGELIDKEIDMADKLKKINEIDEENEEFDEESDDLIDLEEETEDLDEINEETDKKTLKKTKTKGK
jgi:hypothetical protein